VGLAVAELRADGDLRKGRWRRRGAVVQGAATRRKVAAAQGGSVAEVGRSGAGVSSRREKGMRRHCTGRGEERRGRNPWG